MWILNVPRARSGQSIYQIMLVLTCAAMAVAAFFPTWEYFKTYRGPVVEGQRIPRALPAATSPAGTSTPDETAAPAADKGGAGEASAPVPETNATEDAN